MNNEERLSLINELDPNGGALIHYITALNYYEIIPLLHEHGADINIQSSSGITPLVIAAAKGFEKCVKKLMRLGAVFSILNPNANVLNSSDLRYL